MTQPIAVAPVSRRPRVAGFTLLEILVVVFVVGLLSGLVVLQLGSRDGDRELAREAQRLQEVLELARNEAVRSVRQWGLVVTDSGYRFVRFDRDTRRWRRVEERPWQAHEPGSAVAFDLRVTEGSATPPSGGDRSRRDQPRVLLLSSGETTPFQLTLTRTDVQHGWRLNGDGYQAIEAQRVNDIAAER